MISAHDLYLSTIPPLLSIPVYPPPLFLRVSYATDLYLIIQTLNLILLRYDKLHCLCTLLAQSLSMRFLEEEENISEHQIRFKVDGDVRDGKGVKVFASIFH